MQFNCREINATAPSAIYCLFILDHAGKPLGRVQDFDTATGMAVVKAGDFGFYYPKDNVAIKNKLFAELPPELHCRIKEMPELEAIAE